MFHFIVAKKKTIHDNEMKKSTTQSSLPKIIGHSTSFFLFFCCLSQKIKHKTNNVRRCLARSIRDTQRSLKKNQKSVFDSHQTNHIKNAILC